MIRPDRYRVDSDGTHRRAAPILASMLLACGCVAPIDWAAEEAFPEPPSLDKGGRADGFGEGEGYSPEKEAVIARMRVRYGEVRALKEELVVGETHDGFLAVVDEETLYTMSPSSADHARGVVSAENQDRAELYRLVVAGYEQQIREEARQHIEDQRPELRRQVVEQLCDQLSMGEPCSAIADEIVDETLRVAMEAALDAAVEQAMDEVGAEVEAMYACFWQEQATEPGEWVEVETWAGYEWVQKGAARGEKVVARSASTLEDPLDELCFAGEGASEAAMRRYAKLLLTARHDGMTYERIRGLRKLGPGFGPLLAEALANESVDEAFVDDLGEEVRRHHHGEQAHGDEDGADALPRTSRARVGRVRAPGGVRGRAAGGRGGVPIPRAPAPPSKGAVLLRAAFRLRPRPARARRRRARRPRRATDVSRSSIELDFT